MGFSIRWWRYSNMDKFSPRSLGKMNPLEGSYFFKKVGSATNSRKLKKIRTPKLWKHQTPPTIFLSDTWMSQELSKWLVNGLFHLLINGVFLGVITHLPTIDPKFQRDIQVFLGPQKDGQPHDIPNRFSGQCFLFPCQMGWETSQIISARPFCS